ncbi:MAG: hypothetical protein R2849_17500 [Thermomicrobiales bacterium]
MVFIFALQLMQAGAGAIEPLVRTTLEVSNAANALGFGWILAYVLLSGSPAAAIALALLEEGALSSIETYMMIAGSRLGASLFVLLVGSYYVWRGSERLRGLTIGVLSLVVVATIQIPALGVGYLILRTGVLDGFSYRFTALDTIDRISRPVIDRIDGALPEEAVFILGVLTILLAFRLLDYSLPQFRAEGDGIDTLPTMLYRGWVMFLLGMAVTLVTLSVSVSLGILVPLSAKGLIRRENLIPYIMGCNITTYIDTLVIAMLFDDPAGPVTVLAAMVSNLAVSAAVLMFWSSGYQSRINQAVDWTLESRRHLLLFATLMLGIPLILLVI